MEEKIKEKKPSYEDLQELCGQLSQRLQVAYEQIKKMDASNVLQRLNYLFKVLENYAHFNPDFVDKCSSEIEDLLTIPEEETKVENDA